MPARCRSRAAFAPGGGEGLFDEIVGCGWQLLGRNAAALAGVAAADLDRLGVVVGDFVRIDDCDGTYSHWFDRLGVDAVLVRPDFYIFGTAAAGAAGPLVAAARRMVFDDVMLEPRAVAALVSAQAAG